MAEKTALLQQPVISIRISDEMRSRLDTLKEIMAAKSGKAISTSEAAKQLLESAKEERLEFVDLLSEPTDSLVKIRAKVDAKLPLSHAEWTLVAYYCLWGRAWTLSWSLGAVRLRPAQQANATHGRIISEPRLPKASHSTPVPR